MNFLALVQKAWRESGQSGDIPSVDSAMGLQLRFVNWVRDAWVEIQRDSDEWVFMKLMATFSTISGQESYTKGALSLSTLKKPLAVFISIDGLWQPLSLMVSPGSSSESLRLNKSASRPGVCYYSNGVFSFDTIPDQDYQIKVYYVRSEQELTANTDTPIVDESYHRAIVWKAIEQYARFDEDNALYVSAKDRADRAILAMYGDLTPPVTFGRSAF